MLKARNDPPPHEDALIEHIRQNLQPAAPQSNDERTPLEQLFIGFAVCIVALIGAVIEGIAAPVLIPIAIILLLTAIASPATVGRITSIWPFSLLPGSYTADPLRFAAVFALATIPISGIAGFAVYREIATGFGGQPGNRPVAAMEIPLTPSPTTIVRTPSSATLAPTEAMPTPSPTPLPPTPSPAGTVPTTPVPVTPPARQPAMNPAQQAYLTDLYSKSRIIGNSDDLFNQLVDQLNTNKKLISDPGWQKQMQSELAIWQTIYEGSKDVVAPDGLEIVNGKWIEFLGHKNLAADELMRGIQQLDIDLINQGEAEMDTANDVGLKLSELLDRFLGQFMGLPEIHVN